MGVDGRGPWIEEAQRLAEQLSTGELAEILAFSHACDCCETEGELHRSLLQLAEFLGYEFVLYAHMASSYDAKGAVHVENLSNPVAWMEEYTQRGYVETDPVRRELEAWLARGVSRGAFCWDDYERTLSDAEAEVIARRRSYGLHSGFSAFCDSPRQDAVFLVSFASRREERPTERALLVGELVAAHLNRCRKRLDLSSRVARLTTRERVVARWLADGKTNGEIAEILDVSEATAKYHVANILAKLETASRQSAVSILIAERCLT